MEFYIYNQSGELKDTSLNSWRARDTIYAMAGMISQCSYQFEKILNGASNATFSIIYAPTPGCARFVVIFHFTIDLLVQFGSTTGIIQSH